jgi:hypothetical protein
MTKNALRKNLASWDRVLRALAAVGLLVAAIMVPWPLAVRVAALGLPALYMALSSVFGACLGYRLMGRSTCPVEAGR